MGDINLAVFGDIHGKQDLMYECALNWEEENQESIDAILQVGDFETVRKEEDLEHFYALEKYSKLTDFSEYYEGIKEAPILTIFIGGNHEAWGVLEKHNSGGFVAPNMYYLGRAGILDLAGIQIGGLTGVFNPEKYKCSLSKEINYDWKYYRKENIEKLKHEKIDVLLLHDWIKPISELEIIKAKNIETRENQRFSGSQKSKGFLGKIKNSHTPTFKLITDSQPKYVFMGHRHSAHLEAKLNETQIYGLDAFNIENPNSFKFVTFPINK